MTLTVKNESWMDGMDGTCVKLDDNQSIATFVPGKNLSFKELDEYYKTVNLYKLSKDY